MKSITKIDFVIFQRIITKLIFIIIAVFSFQFLLERILTHKQL